MNLRNRAGGLVLIAVGFAGCGDPRVAPVMPPGVSAPRVAPPTQGGVPEAKGETAAAVFTAPDLAVSDPTPLGQERKLSDGLVYITEREGTGAQVKPGQTATIRYVGRLQDGTKFYDSADHGGAESLAVGKGAGIQGLHEGVSGMKVGEKRKLIVPGHLAYGAGGVKGVIPPNSDLILDVELVDVK